MYEILFYSSEFAFFFLFFYFLSDVYQISNFTLLNVLSFCRIYGRRNNNNNNNDIGSVSARTVEFIWQVRASAETLMHVVLQPE